MKLQMVEPDKLRTPRLHGAAATLMCLRELFLLSWNRLINPASCIFCGEPGTFHRIML